MSDEQLNDLLLALETDYDTLRQPIGAYLDQRDFETRRQDAVEKLIRAMKALDLDIGDILDQPIFTAVAPES